MQLEIINRELNESIKKVMLPQAIRISCIYLKKFYPNSTFEALYEKIVFKSNTSLSFQKSEIDRIRFIEEEGVVKAELTLNFLGIFGSSSPLPSHYSEMVLDSLDEDMVLYDFLNLFNHHLQKFIYPIWEKHRYYIQYKKDLSDRFSKYALSFLGIHNQNKEHSKLKLQKLISAIGILSMKHKSSGTIKSILKHYLSHNEIEVIQCIPAKYEIPSWQQSSLGSNNITLGSDFLIGESIISKNSKFRVLLKNIKSHEIIDYSILGKKLEEIKSILTFSLNEQFEHEVCLDIKKEEKVSFILGEKNYLGINCWIGDLRDDEQIIMA
ncbi:type VI secretion system baseplate subunit TssG [Halarcobacter ebronensis]|uniref:Type VI secretion system baseplate subunit TssG n=1 Tax=Halarcobacter ebronensis TaxID=1462615 RepID=A0A4Q0YAH9_9BACT|nr:type VI secretion system baseplate subunit TssG [Halarcobacter ebronensis]RXJ67327.1 type VI secretion system baseplate subunit TssG [Halarcobacter ebronensis]